MAYVAPLVGPVACLFVFLRLENQRFQLGRCFQREHRRFGIIAIVLKAQLDAFAFKSVWVRLNLNILVQETINGLLRFM